MNIIRKYYDLFKSCCYVLNVSVKVLYHVKRKSLTRDLLDSILIQWGHDTLNLFNTTVIKRNEHNVKFDPDQKYIIISNHNSLFDVPIIYAHVEPTVRLMAKRELLKVPIWGHAIIAAENPVIDRHNRQQAIKDLEHTRSLLAKGIKVWIAPEGTRPLDGQLGRFKKGAFILAIQAGAKIVPIAIKGSHELLPAKSLDVQYNRTIEVIYGEPIDASAYTIENKEALIERARNSIAELLAS